MIILWSILRRTMIAILIIRTGVRIIATVRIEIRLGNMICLWLNLWLRVTRLELGTGLERMSIQSSLILLLLKLVWEL